MMPEVLANCPKCLFYGNVSERLDGLRRLCPSCSFEWDPRDLGAAIDRAHGIKEDSKG